jgi:hypothetical protein
MKKSTYTYQYDENSEHPHVVVLSTREGHENKYGFKSLADVHNFFVLEKAGMDRAMTEALAQDNSSDIAAERDKLALLDTVLEHLDDLEARIDEIDASVERDDVIQAVENVLRDHLTKSDVEVILDTSNVVAELKGVRRDIAKRREELIVARSNRDVRASMLSQMRHQADHQ